MKRGIPARACAEKQFMAQVIDLAQLLGWLVYHTYDSRRSAAGYPDLTLVRERTIFAELKTARGILHPEQEIWREALEHAGAEYYLWRPTDWQQIQEILQNRSTTPPRISHHVL